MTRVAAAAALLLAGLALLAPPARAHDVGLSRVRLDLMERTVEGEIAFRASDIEAALGLRISDPGITDPASGRTDPDALAARADAVLAYVTAGATVTDSAGAVCAVSALEPPLADDDGVVLYLGWRCAAPPAVYRNRLFHETDRVARQVVLLLTGEDMDQALLDRDRGDVALRAPPPLTEAAGRYLLSGVEHIFLGYDHVAFLIAILLWARRVTPVVKVVTAFTLAHSITLTLAVLDLVTLPPALVEPLIAASIVYVAAENLFSRRVERRWRMTFLLGLIHGFGFAGALKAYGLPADALAVALAGFNIGVEIGQVAIVALVIPALLAIDRLLARTGQAVREPRVVYSLSAAILALGLYWLAARTMPML